jgi:hypothetical protein
MQKKEEGGKYLQKEESERRKKSKKGKKQKQKKTKMSLYKIRRADYKNKVS